MVGAVAQECQASGQLAWAVELYEQAGQAPSALHVVSTQLALLVQPALSSSAKGAPRLPFVANMCPGPRC